MKTNETTGNAKTFLEPFESPEIPELPNPFVFLNDTPVKSLTDWEERKCEIKQVIQHYAYGYLPNEPDTVTVDQEGESTFLEPLTLMEIKPLTE